MVDLRKAKLLNSTISYCSLKPKNLSDIFLIFYMENLSSQLISTNVNKIFMFYLFRIIIINQYFSVD